MSIYIITGKNGHGKSAFMAKWTKDLLKDGNRIFSNTKLNPEKMGLKKSFTYREINGIRYSDIEGDIRNEADRNNPNIWILYWQNYDDWRWFEKGVVVCDEGLAYFDARMWERLPRSMRLKFTQHRKDKIDLILNIQHYTFIDKTLRVLCSRFINVSLRFGSPKFKKSWIPRISRVHEYELAVLNRCENLGIDPYDITKENAEKWNIEPYAVAWFWISNKVMSYYDTGVKVVESKEEELTHSERVCAKCGKVAISHW